MAHFGLPRSTAYVGSGRLSASPGVPASIPIASRQVPMFLFLLSLLVEHVLPSLAPRLEKGHVLPTPPPDSVSAVCMEWPQNFPEHSWAPRPQAALQLLLLCFFVVFFFHELSPF